MNQAANTQIDPSEQTALNFALADYQWRTLSADHDRWIDPIKQRELATVFLRYHAAKLALVFETEASA